jgi:hypothetical protein
LTHSAICLLLYPSTSSHRGLDLYHPAGNLLLQRFSKRRLSYGILLKSKFSTEYHLVLPISNSSIFHLFQEIQELLTSCSSSSRRLYHCFYLSFNNVFQKAVLTQDVNNPVSLLSFLLYRIFLSSSTLCNTSSFLTQSVQHISSILLQPHILKPSRYL